jgi:hypothetical protein
MVAMDWTDFDADNQATIMLALISDQGRSTPLVWLTVDKSTLKDHRNFYEHRVLIRLASCLPAGIKVCIVADRGSGDQKLYRMLTEEVPSRIVWKFGDEVSDAMNSGSSCQAMHGGVSFSGNVCQPSTFRMVIWPEASRAQNNIAAVSADGSTVCVLIRLLNSSWSRSIAFVVRADFHWLSGNRTSYPQSRGKCDRQMGF